MNRDTRPILSKRRILVVEDNNSMRDILARALEENGYMVYQAADGRTALDLLKRIPNPGIILSDIEMPNMDGLQFLKEVRENNRWTIIPFIFLTSYDSPQDIQSGRELGVDDYLTKPVDVDALVRIVNARLLRSAELQLSLVEKAYLDTVNVLANTIEGRDPTTRGHVERVARYARWLAEALGWSPDRLRVLEFGARLHDVGKIVIPDHILKKTGPLSPEEWELMKTHPTEGAKILRNISHLQDAVPYALYHHEKWDGSGYPQGLKGTQIPLEARILALVDVYDSLTTERPYHPPRPHAEVVKYLQLRSGVHFDPDLTQVFIAILAEMKPS